MRPQTSAQNDPASDAAERSRELLEARAKREAAYPPAVRAWLAELDGCAPDAAAANRGRNALFERQMHYQASHADPNEALVRAVNDLGPANRFLEREQEKQTGGVLRMSTVLLWAAAALGIYALIRFLFLLGTNSLPKNLPALLEFFGAVMGFGYASSALLAARGWDMAAALALSVLALVAGLLLRRKNKNER